MGDDDEAVVTVPGVAQGEAQESTQVEQTTEVAQAEAKPEPTPLKTPEEARALIERLFRYQIAKEAMSAGVILRSKKFEMSPDDNAAMYRRLMKEYAMQRFPTSEVSIKSNGIFIKLIPTQVNMLRLTGQYRYTSTTERDFIQEVSSSPKYGAAFVELIENISRARGRVDYYSISDGSIGLMARCSLNTLRSTRSQAGYIADVMKRLGKLKSALDTMMELVPNIDGLREEIYAERRRLEEERIARTLQVTSDWMASILEVDVPAQREEAHETDDVETMEEPETAGEAMEVPEPIAIHDDGIGDPMHITTADEAEAVSETEQEALNRIMREMGLR